MFADAYNIAALIIPRFITSLSNAIACVYDVGGVWTERYLRVSGRAFRDLCCYVCTQ
jgi:hypothetical protein